MEFLVPTSIRSCRLDLVGPKLIQPENSSSCSMPENNQNFPVIIKVCFDHGGTHSQESVIATK